MAEFILHTDPLELQNTRQSTKIVFLQKEIIQLQDHIRDLEQVARINREALKIATSQHFQLMSKRGNQNDTTASIMDSTISQNYSKGLQQLVEQLQEENLRLMDIVEKVKEERNIAQSRALISEQISEEAQRRESEAVMELEEKIYDLRKLLQDKEYAMQELEKVKLVPEDDGTLIKYREVINPTEQTLKLCNEIDSLNGMLAKVSKNMNKLHVEKQNLININFDLTTELSKIRAMFSSPLNVPHKYQMFNNKENLNNSVGNFAAPFVQPTVEQPDDCPSPLPDKVNYPQMNHKKALVPKLNLSEALKIQENLVNKSNPAGQPKNVIDQKAQEKIKQLEEEIEMLRKRLSVELVNRKLLSDQVDSFERSQKQILAVNEILVKSNKRYEERLSKMNQSLEYYKEFYNKFLDHPIKNNVTPTKTTSTTGFPTSEKGKTFNEKYELENVITSDKMAEEVKEADDEEGKEVNVSVLETKEEDSHQTREKVAFTVHGGNNIFEFTKEQCKLFLLNLAKDLYINTNISKSPVSKNILKKLEFGRSSPANDPIIRLQRSVSNALDYVSERKKLIFEPRVDSKDKKTTKLKKQKKNSGLAGDQDKHGNSLFIGNFSFNESAEKGSPLKYDGPFFGYGQDEVISFNVDIDEFNKQKVVDVSFISNNDILDQIKHD